MLKLKKQKRGAILIEAAFVLPLFFLLIFGIFEAYRMKVAEKLADTVSMNVVTDVTSRRSISSSQIEKIIETCNDEMDIRLLSNAQIDSRVRCSVEIYKNHDTAKASSIPTTWPTSQGKVQYIDGATSLQSGYTVAVTAFIKYEFLTQLTKSAFTGNSKDVNFYIRKRHFMKCT